MTNYLLSNGSVLIIHEKPIVIKGKYSCEFYNLGGHFLRRYTQAKNLDIRSYIEFFWHKLQLKMLHEEINELLIVDLGI